MTTSVAAPLIVHLVYRFDTGGLENGVVNLINHLPVSAYRHAVVSLTDVVPAFAARLKRADVRCIALGKPPGHGMRAYAKLWRVLRELRPSIVHSRNLAALECQVVSAAAGVTARIHSEHGRDLSDLNNGGRRYLWMRKAYDPFVHRYVALSRELQDFLQGPVGIAERRVQRICNGVDLSRFSLQPTGGTRPADSPFSDDKHFVVGTVGRMQAIKNQTGLARAFVLALQQRPALRERLRLVMVGDGPLRAQASDVVQQAGLGDLVWLPGERADVPDLMASLDCFVLPSLSEGISNTILEAMACSLPVLATDVGGNAELVVPGVTGEILPVNDDQALADALIRMAENPQRAQALGDAGRARVEQQFSLEAMVAAYRALYDQSLNESARASRRR